MNTEILTSTSRIPARPHPDAAPLTYQQRWYLSYIDNLNFDFPSLATAIRLTGPLCIPSIEKSIRYAVERHEALRTRIVTGANSFQAIEGVPDELLEVKDLSAQSSPIAEEEAKRCVNEFADQPCKLVSDAIFKALLVKVQENDFVLVVTIHHIVSDGYSIHILFRDIVNAYKSIVAGSTPPLSPPAPQFPDYAAWQANFGDEWVKKQDSYWIEHLAGAKRIYVSKRERPKSGLQLRWQTTSVKLGLTESERLRAWCSRESSTLPMILLTAYIVTLSNRSGERDVVIGTVASGRHRRDLSNIIGFLAFPIYLRIQVGEADSFKELLGKVTREYYSALSHQDYGCAQLKMVGAAHVYNPAFNWHPLANVAANDGTVKYQIPQGSDSIQLGPFPIKKKTMEFALDEGRYARDCEPGLWITDSASGISGQIFYQQHQFSEEEATSLGADYLALCRNICGKADELALTLC